MQNNFSQFYFIEDNNNLIIVYRAISGRESGDKVLVTSNKDTALLHAKQYKKKLEKYKVDRNDLEPGPEALAFYDGKIPSIEKAVEIEALVDPKKLIKLSTLYYSDTLGKFVSIPNEAYYYGDEDEEPIRVKARDKSEKAPKIMFARWGGMNPTRDKDLEKRFSKSEEDGNPIGGKGGFMSRDHLEVFIPGKVKESK